MHDRWTTLYDSEKWGKKKATFWMSMVRWKWIHSLAASFLSMHHVTPKHIDEEISETNDYLIVGLENCVLKS
jgi:hypothetical protein